MDLDVAGGDRGPWHPASQRSCGAQRVALPAPRTARNAIGQASRQRGWLRPWAAAGPEALALTQGVAGRAEMCPVTQHPRLR